MASQSLEKSLFDLLQLLRNEPTDGGASPSAEWSAQRLLALVAAGSGALIVPASAIDRRTGLYYGPEGQISATGSAPPNNTLRCMPMYFPFAQHLDSIGIETTANGEAGSVVRLGIYHSKPDESYPGDLLVDAGTVAGDGGAAFKPLAIDVEVEGVVWLAVCCQSAPTTRPSLRVLTSSDYAGYIGSTTGLIQANANAFAQSAVSGALPPTFTNTPAAAAASFPQVRIA